MQSCKRWSSTTSSGVTIAIFSVRVILFDFNFSVPAQINESESNTYKFIFTHNIVLITLFIWPGDVTMTSLTAGKFKPMTSDWSKSWSVDSKFLQSKLNNSRCHMIHEYISWVTKFRDWWIVVTIYPPDLQRSYKSCHSHGYCRGFY